jgi:hypothetical protein
MSEARQAYVLTLHGILDPYPLSLKALKKSGYFLEELNLCSAHDAHEGEKLAALARLRFRRIKRHHGGLCGADRRRRGEQQRARDCSRSSCNSHKVHYAEGHRSRRSAEGWLTSQTRSRTSSR